MLLVDMTLFQVLFCFSLQPLHFNSLTAEPPFQKGSRGNSLAVQWLGLDALTAGAPELDHW